MLITKIGTYSTPIEWQRLGALAISQHFLQQSKTKQITSPNRPLSLFVDELHASLSALPQNVPHDRVVALLLSGAVSETLKKRPGQLSFGQLFPGVDSQAASSFKGLPKPVLVASYFLDQFSNILANKTTPLQSSSSSLSPSSSSSSSFLSSSNSTSVYTWTPDLLGQLYGQLIMSHRVTDGDPSLSSSKPPKESPNLLSSTITSLFSDGIVNEIPALSLNLTESDFSQMGNYITAHLAATSLRPSPSNQEAVLCPRDLAAFSFSGGSLSLFARQPGPFKDGAVVSKCCEVLTSVRQLVLQRQKRRIGPFSDEECVQLAAHLVIALVNKSGRYLDRPFLDKLIKMIGNEYSLDNYAISLMISQVNKGLHAAPSFNARLKSYFNFQFLNKFYQ